jgi:hypothetical protein
MKRPDERDSTNQTPQMVQAHPDISLQEIVHATDKTCPKTTLLSSFFHALLNIRGWVSDQLGNSILFCEANSGDH